MSSFTTNIIGLDNLLAKMGRVPDKIHPNLEAALVTCAFRVQATAKRSIQNSPPDPETGRSSPGNPPLTDTGRLVNSIFVELDRSDTDHSVVMVGTNVSYGKDLEFGTLKMEARPWLQPAMEENNHENLQTLSDAIKDSLKNAGAA